MNVSILTIRNRILLSSLLLAAFPLEAQDFSQILSSIEQHSLSLSAARESRNAVQAEARTERRLEDPEVGFNYLFGSKGIGDRRDVSLSQTFDLPHVQVRRYQLSREEEQLAQYRYLDYRQQVLLEASRLCIDIVYCNAMMEHLNEDLEETHAMADAYQQLFEKGEATVIDRNKAHQAVLFFEAEYRAFLAQKENLLDQLKVMNGGNAVSISDSTFLLPKLEANFNDWYAAHPAAHLAAGEVNASQRQLQLSRSQWTPKLRVGYMGEFERDSHYQGPSVGLTLPLWRNGAQTKAAQSRLSAAQMQEEETRLKLQSQYEGVYRETLQLQETCRQYRHHLTECDNTQLLQKSLEAGQITLVTYLQERQYVHEMHVRLLEAERDLKAKMTMLEIL